MMIKTLEWNGRDSKPLWLMTIILDYRGKTPKFCLFVWRAKAVIETYIEQLLVQFLIFLNFGQKIKNKKFFLNSSHLLCSSTEGLFYELKKKS